MCVSNNKHQQPVTTLLLKRPPDARIRAEKRGTKHQHHRALLQDELTPRLACLLRKCSRSRAFSSADRFLGAPDDLARETGRSRYLDDAKAVGVAAATDDSNLGWGDGGSGSWVSGPRGCRLGGVCGREGGRTAAASGGPTSMAPSTPRHGGGSRRRKVGFGVCLGFTSARFSSRAASGVSSLMMCRALSTSLGKHLKMYSKSRLVTIIRL
ncbi:hypothetical protein TOPH_04296 [Tolypocladium ophioglossoides CBS 100239]|uniref:Uncharacterized protein n=1 Tax=Tolypocladium ophioglossoides (strain CBS 100239) TaxID=1163406 RepID=A0A0L0NAW4_TOLOC|nr:hypothetical protein TOPH_04296 [Tolypocladium ophioglossoides CBS 100239]